MTTDFTTFERERKHGHVELFVQIAKDECDSSHAVIGVLGFHCEVNLDWII